VGDEGTRHLDRLPNPEVSEIFIFKF